MTGLVGGLFWGGLIVVVDLGNVVGLLYRRLTRRGRRKRAVAAGLLELPGGLIVDVAEVATMAWGSVRYRTIVL